MVDVVIVIFIDLSEQLLTEV